MIAVDANILVYAVMDGFPRHARARAWLEDRLNGRDRVGLPWQSIVAFLRLVTNRRVFPRPMDTRSAWGVVEAWISRPCAWIPSPTDRHADVLAGLLGMGGISANLVPDAHLAALAMEHGLLLVTTDGDFARFPGLRWENPLE